jgi:hypothetical protein
MNNQELELKVKELLEIENFFDMIIAVKDFEKEYKGSDFFKATKMPLVDVIKNAKVWYLSNFNELKDKIQSLINRIDLSTINNLMNQVSEIFQIENQETFDLIQDFKDIVK